MLDPEIRQAIREEIKHTMAVLLPGLVGKANTTQSESIDQPYIGMAEMPERPIMHPYGLVSRAPKGTTSIHGRMSGHASNRFVLGHMDNERKNIDCNQGEVVLYNQYGQQIRLENGKIALGKKVDEQAVLGNVLAEFIGKLIDELETGDLVITTTPGNPTAPNPTAVARFEILRTQYLDTEATNILSQETYLERIA